MFYFSQFWPCAKNDFSHHKIICSWCFIFRGLGGEKIIFRTLHNYGESSAAVYVFFFALHISGRPCMFFFRAPMRKIIFRTVPVLSPDLGGRVCFFSQPDAKNYFLHRESFNLITAKVADTDYSIFLLGLWLKNERRS